MPLSWRGSDPASDGHDCFILFVASTLALAEAVKPSRTALLCKKIGERAGGLKKTCYYDCGAWEGGRTENIYDHCPSWTVRWRLNRNSQFGPHASL
jgi:hypothetical protein